jgi:4-amino-4-deoxy-L-arabinose transferase-like glycosyltransferase
MESLKVHQYLQLKVVRIILVLLVLLFTFVLRAHNYDRVPISGHLEEMLYAWSGIYLLETGVPVSWSTLDYPPRAEVYRGVVGYKGGEPKTSVTLYSPWLDEPPLFSLLVGKFAQLYGADRHDVIPSAYIRFPIVLLATTTSLLLFFVARLFFGFMTSLLAMLLYGTVPIFVVSSRLAVPENLIALLYLLAFFLVIHFYKTLQVRYILPIPFIAGVAGLSKPTGFFILPFALFVVWFVLLERKTRFKKLLPPSLYLILFTLPFIYAFFAYGLHFDAEIFWKITQLQSFRPVGFGSLAWFFISPAFDIDIIKDSWYVFCLLSAAAFIFYPKKGLEKLLGLGLIYWLMVVVISGGEGDLLPWYRYPIFPFLAILGAWGVAYLIKNANMFTLFLGAGMLLGNRLLLVNAFRPNVSPLEYRLLFSALISPGLAEFLQLRYARQVCQYVLVGIVIVGIYFNTIYVYNQFELTCESITCPFGPQTFLSTVHIPVIWKLMVLGEPTLH